ncbi:MAG: TetR/AcrR family transcriptional regulator [bacterium]
MTETQEREQPEGKVRRTQAERSTATRRKLLEATVTCIVEEGIARASGPRICRIAGVSRGAQLHHFPTKASLVAAAAEHLLMRRHTEFRASHGGRLSAAGLGSAVEALWAIYTGPTLQAWQELVNASRSDADLRELLAQVNQRFFGEARRTLALLLGMESAEHPQLDAWTRFVLSVLDGLAMNQILETDEEQAHAVLAALQAVIAGWVAEVKELSASA